MMAAAERLTPVLLELGGKDAMIVDDDADLAKAAEACRVRRRSPTRARRASRSSASTSRRRCTTAFVDEVVKQVRELKVGGDDGHLGAMTSPAQVAIVKDHLDDAIAKGAKVLTGGPDAISGSYIQPTVLTSVGPRHEDDDRRDVRPGDPDREGQVGRRSGQARERQQYGFGSTVFAGKAARAIADRLRAGMTSINSVMAFAGIPTLPFGGVGDSGFGRIHGDEGIREFTRVKSTAEQLMPMPINMMSFQPAEGRDEAPPRDDQAALRRRRDREGRRSAAQAALTYSQPRRLPGT